MFGERSLLLAIGPTLSLGWIHVGLLVPRALTENHTSSTIATG